MPYCRTGLPRQHKDGQIGAQRLRAAGMERQAAIIGQVFSGGGFWCLMAGARRGEIRFDQGHLKMGGSGVNARAVLGHVLRGQDLHGGKHEENSGRQPPLPGPPAMPRQRP